MELSISEVRRRLPELVRLVCKDSGTVLSITVHGQRVAELRAVQPEPEPGAAARKLLELMEKLPVHQGPKRRVSARVKQHLYASARRGR